MPGQSGVYGVDDEVEEIGLVCRVAVGAGEDYPVGAAGSEHLCTSGLEMGKEMSSSATVPGRFASHQASIHRLVIASLNSHIELRVELRLQDRSTVKGDGAIQQPARPQEGEERRQSRGHIHQVEKCLRNEQVPGPLALLAGDETQHVDGLRFHPDVLTRPLHMQLCLTVLLHLQTLRSGPMGETATGFSNERGLHVNGGVGRMGEHTASEKPLHHRAKTCSNLEDLQRLLWGGARQRSDQALPDGLIQRSVVDALLGSEIAREAIGVGDRHGSCTPATALGGRRPRPARVPTYAP